MNRTRVHVLRSKLTARAFPVPRYHAGRKLTGLVYVQRISDNRFSGQQGKNLRMFQKLCGADTLTNVVVLTTFWDREDAAVADARERQMQAKFFKGVVDGGARFMRHDRTAASARAVLSYVFAELAPVITQIQVEMGVEGKALVDTAAGAVQREEIERIIAKHREEVAGLKAEMEAVKAGNTAARRELEDELASVRRQLGRWQTENAELKAGLQAQSAKWQAESAALRESVDRESGARRRLEGELAGARANHEALRREQEQLLAEHTSANSRNLEQYRRLQERLEDSERRVQFLQQEHPSNHDSDSSGGFSQLLPLIALVASRFLPF